MWQAVAYSSSLHKVRFLHLTIRKAIIVPRDAKVTKAFIQGVGMPLIGYDGGRQG